MSEQRDWTQLPQELLTKISTHLPEIPDLLRFRSVCPPWRSAAKPTTTLLRPQLPWLYLEPSLQERANTNIRRFFSIAEKRTYSIPLPEHLNMLFGSSSGRAITYTLIDFETAARSITMLNPITRSSTPLPPLLPVKQLAFARPINLKFFQPDLVATVYESEAFAGRPCVFFCRVGDTTWQKIDMQSCPVYGDFTYHGGCFFVFDCTLGDTSVFDAGSLQKVVEIPFPRARMMAIGTLRCQYYLVEASSGELLLLVRYPKGCKTRFLLFQLDESGQQAKWVEVNSIGNNVLFADGAHAMCFDAGGFEGCCCRGNCIYFLDYHEFDIDFPMTEDTALRLFDIGTGLVECVRLFSDSSQTQLWSSTWIVPSLC